MTDTQEKLRLQSKELKDAIGQRKLAMTEYTEVSDKYEIKRLFTFYSFKYSPLYLVKQVV